MMNDRMTDQRICQQAAERGSWQLMMAFFRKATSGPLLLWVLAVGMGVAARFQASEHPFDIVIKNGRIVDGTGNPWLDADLAITDGKFAKIGHLDSEQARQVIDAGRKIVAPGFIDVHTHVEGNLEKISTADNFVRMGVTTIVTGNCGSSRLPVGEYLAALQQHGVSLNVATLVGHNSVRRQVMKMDAREPTPEELEKMEQGVEQAMKEGAVGLSTGLIYEPGSFAKTDEIIELARVVARFGGLYVTHLRDEGNQVEEAIQEALRIGVRAGCPVNISHFKVSSKKRWGDSRLTVQLVADARRRGQQVTVDQYVYPASSAPLSIVLPDWVFDGGNDKALERLKDPATRARIKREMIDTIKRSGFKNYSYAYVADYKPSPSFNGKSISEITKQVRRKSGVKEEAEQIIEMVIAGGSSMVYHKMNEADIETILRQPFTMIASDSGVREFGQGVPHPRGYGNTLRVLARYVRETGVITLEDAIRKMTSLPAQTFGFWDRGVIRQGFAADVVIFDEAEVADQATFENPHQYPKGIEAVIVNGQLVVTQGQHTGAKPGKILLGPGRPSLH
jgi:N-acyl-D-amino-acid deacylase